MVKILKTKKNAVYPTRCSIDRCILNERAHQEYRLLTDPSKTAAAAEHDHMGLISRGLGVEPSSNVRTIRGAFM